MRRRLFTRSAAAMLPALLAAEELRCRWAR